MPFNPQPHINFVDPISRVASVHQDNDFIILSNAGVKFYVQHGQVYGGAGSDPVATPDLPEWFWSAYRALSPTARKSVELELPEDRVQVLTDLSADFMAILNNLPQHLRDQLLAANASAGAKVRVLTPLLPSDKGKTPELNLAVSTDLPDDVIPATSIHWICPECDQEVPKAQKGVHTARHRKQAKALAQKAN